MGDDYFSKFLSFGYTPPTAIYESAPLPQQATTPLIDGVTGRSLKVSLESPYLPNHDTKFTYSTQPEFIFPDGGISRTRGRFELAFAQIGTAVITGAALGALAGFANGMKNTKALKQYGKIKRTQILNHIIKQGSATGNTLGAMSVMYSGMGVLIQNARGEEDEFNSLLAGTLTGMLYKCTGGLRSCVNGGAVGLGLSGIYFLYLITRSDSRLLLRK